MKKLEYFLVISIILLLKIVPFSWGHSITKIFSFLIRKVFNYRIKTVRDNLEMAFPEKSIHERENLLSDVYYNFAALWLEFLQNWRVDKQYIDKYFKIHNWEVLESALSENKGLILYTGHLGNIEWLGQCMSLKFPGIYAVSQRVHNKYVNDLVEKSRSQHGAKLIPPKGAIKKGLTLLKNNEIMAIAGDQDARHKGIFVNFFGIPSSTAIGTAIFHIETGAPIVHAALIRKKWGYFELFFERLTDSKKLVRTDQNIFYITQLHTNVLEKWVKKYPGQYFWTHRRWKTKPDEEALGKYNRFFSEHRIKSMG